MKNFFSWFKKQTSFIKALCISAPVILVLSIVLPSKTSNAPSSTTEVVDNVKPEPEKLVSDSRRISMAQYGMLSTGMSYTDAVRLLGRDGQEMSSNDLAGVHTVMYQWASSDGGNMNAMFQGDKLVSKAQFGLK